MKKIVPFDRFAPFNNSNIPEPKIPAKPVPEPKKPTVLLGNPLQKPNVVDSPRALPTPNNTDENNAI